MRYYNIKVTGAPPDIFPARYENGAQWGTITPFQEHDPNAQQIEFQIMAVDTSTPIENSTMTIHGVSWDQIKACNQLVGKPITILGGMSPGLPLATFQSIRDKKLMDGVILKCWGNWIGNETSIGMTFLPIGLKAEDYQQAAPTVQGNGNNTSGDTSSATTQNAEARRYNKVGFRSLDQSVFPTSSSALIGAPSIPSIDQVISAIGGKLTSEFDIGSATFNVGGMVASFFGGGNIAPLAAPLNIIHNLMPNMPLSSAIQETLSKTFPNASINMAISAALKLAYQDAGMYQSLEQYSGFINNLAQSILGTKNYPGIHMSTIDNTIDVWDGTRSIGSNDVSYLDLIGQPTWLTINTISVKVVLRGGWRIGQDITLPQTLVGFAGADSVFPKEGAQLDQRTHITLPGTYKILKIMHIGDFRNPDGASWSTNLECATNSSVTGQATASQQVDNSNKAQDSQIQSNIDATQMTLTQPTNQSVSQQMTRLTHRPARRYG